MPHCQTSRRRCCCCCWEIHLPGARPGCSEVANEARASGCWQCPWRRPGRSWPSGRCWAISAAHLYRNSGHLHALATMRARGIAAERSACPVPLPAAGSSAAPRIVAWGRDGRSLGSPARMFPPPLLPAACCRESLLACTVARFVTPAPCPVRWRSRGALPRRRRLPSGAFSPSSCRWAAPLRGRDAWGVCTLVTSRQAALRPAPAVLVAAAAAAAPSPLPSLSCSNTPVDHPAQARGQPIGGQRV